MRVFAGVDIGGTKCAVSLGQLPSLPPTNPQQDEIVSPLPQIVGRRRFLTLPSPEANIRQLMAYLDDLLSEHPDAILQAIGISCGGPLDSRRGLILAPPNLPDWIHVDIVTPFQGHYGVSVQLQNDANACALAEWLWGAGRGHRNIIFLTFGTGMGAGLILDGRLYTGANDMAGEVGHVRLEDEGPVGHGKAGSFEGFCSGGGIAQLGGTLAAERIRAGANPLYCRTVDDLPTITAQTIGQAAQEGDATALEVLEQVARKLGRGLALLVDILNPERIIIGSIWGRQRALLEPLTLAVLQEEALPHSLAVCEIVPAGLGEQVGDFASLSVAVNEQVTVQVVINRSTVSPDL